MICLVFISVFLTFISNLSAADNCCPSGQVLLKRKDRCWDPQLNITGPYVMKCNETYRFKKGYSILMDGAFNVTISADRYEIFEETLYCTSNSTQITDVHLKNVTSVLLLCIDKNEKNAMFDDKVLGYCMIVSVIFLAPTAIIYTALSELRDVQGKSIINFCTSSAIGQGILAIMKIIEYTDMALCATRGFLAYFFIIVSFFWTNSISIQVLLNIRRPSTLDYSWKEFKWYFLYSWGCPTIITICMAVVNFHPGRHAKPGIGSRYCWFRNNEQQWYYMYSIVTLLLAVNICIFIYISIVLWRQSFSSSHLRALKYKFVMTVRLILVMGLPWVFEIMETFSEEHIVWYIIDIFNCLQGILIFLLLVVFRRRVVKLMHKHGWLNCISGYVENYLAVEDDEENVVHHTDVPMSMCEKSEINE